MTPKKALETFAADCRKAADAGEPRPAYDGPSLVLANLYRADLRRADLSEADLHRANLYGAALSGADLRRADLCED